jgi:hypothetical protein
MEAYRPVINAAVGIQNQLLTHSKILDDEYRLKLNEFESMINVIETLRQRDDISTRKQHKRL